MHTNCFLEIMQNLATKNRVASKWAKNVYEKILDGWDNMDIPQLSKTQQSSSKAKSKIKAIGPTRH